MQQWHPEQHRYVRTQWALPCSHTTQAPHVATQAARATHMAANFPELDHFALALLLSHIASDDSVDELSHCVEHVRTDVVAQACAHGGECLHAIRAVQRSHIYSHNSFRQCLDSAYWPFPETQDSEHRRAGLATSRSLSVASATRAPT